MAFDFIKNKEKIHIVNIGEWAGPLGKAWGTQAIGGILGEVGSSGRGRGHEGRGEVLTEMLSHVGRLAVYCCK